MVSYIRVSFRVWVGLGIGLGVGLGLSLDTYKTIFRSVSISSVAQWTFNPEVQSLVGTKGFFFSL